MVVEAQIQTQCPACGTELSHERWSEGLCPACVFELALTETRDAAVQQFEANKRNVEAIRKMETPLTSQLRAYVTKANKSNLHVISPHKLRANVKFSEMLLNTVLGILDVLHKLDYRFAHTVEQNGFSRG